MRRTIIIAACLLTVAVATAQEKQFDEALSQGRQTGRFYRMKNLKAKMITVEKVKELAMKRDFILGNHSTKEIGRFGDVATTIKTWDFIPRKDYELYIAENMNAGSKAADYTQEGTAWIADVSGANLQIRRLDNVKWTGQVKNNRIDGKGQAIVQENDLRFLAFEGIFDEGIPQGNLTIRLYTPNIKELKFDSRNNHSQQATLGQKSEGMTMVKFKDRYGFINSDGVLVAQPVYKEVKDFKNGVAYVTETTVEMKIDKTGRVVALSENAQLTFADMLSMRKQYPQLAQPIEDYASRWVENDSRTQDEIANTAKEFPALKSKTDQLKAALYQRDCRQVEAAYQSASAAALANLHNTSGEGVTDNFISVYTNHKYDPDTLMPTAKQLKHYYDVCNALDFALRSSYWTDSYCPSFNSSEGNSHRGRINNAIDICCTDTSADFRDFYAQAHSPLRDKLDRLESRLKSDRAAYDRAYARYQAEEARREAERKAEEARREAKRRMVRDILENMSHSSIYRYIVKTSDWSKGRILDSDDDFTDSKEITFRDIKSDDEDDTFRRTIYHTYDAKRGVNYYTGVPGLLFPKNYTNELDAIIAAFMDEYNESWHHGEK
jgi:hypothetical protein